MAPMKVRLDGVPETALWTLYHRALDAGRPASPFVDPKAIELLGAIEFPFRERFGPDILGLAELLGQRAATLDTAVREVLAEDPDALVVSLGEGLETQFWRVDNGTVRWFTVDLPAMAAIRMSLLPDDPPRRRTAAGSALSTAWLDACGAGPGDRVVVVAQGLLMYLQPAEVEGLIATCAQAFGRGVMLFDVVPRWATAVSGHRLPVLPGRYTPPPMPWGCDGGTEGRLARLHPNIVRVRALPAAPAGGPLAGFLMPAGRRLPLLRRLIPSVIRLDFGATAP